MTRHTLVPCACGLAITVCLVFGIAAWAEPTTAPATGPSTLPTKPGTKEGWVSGTILGMDGKPMADFEVRAERVEPMGMGPGAAGASKRPRVVKTMTDETGYFLFRDLEPVKTYTIVSGTNEIGWIYEEKEILAGKEIKLGELKMFKLN